MQPVKWENQKPSQETDADEDETAFGQAEETGIAF
jgi:hypothetical protein